MSSMPLKGEVIKYRLGVQGFRSTFCQNLNVSERQGSSIMPG